MSQRSSPEGPAGSPARRASLVWLGILVTAAALYVALRDARLADVWDALAASSYVWLVPALAAYAASILLRAVRWRYLFVGETRPPMGCATRALVVGYFFNNVLPVRAGDGARVLVLKRIAGTSHAETAGTVITERAYDILTLLALLLVALPWLPEITWLRPAGWLAAGVGVLVLLSIALLARYRERPLRFALLPLSRLPALSVERIEWWASRLRHGLSGLLRPRLIVAALWWTVLGWIVMAMSFWLVLRAFHVDVGPVAGLLVLVATGLSMILPSAPAALGVFEAAAVVALGAYDVPASQALSFALVLHAMTVVFHVATGFAVLHALAPSFRRRLPTYRIANR